MMHSAMLLLEVCPGNRASRSKGFASGEKATVQSRVSVGKEAQVFCVMQRILYVGPFFEG